ncbi:MAG TPA: thiamine phosphate synthase [Chthoniobacterales bacterium]|nr:thiamine phosphate synthase [Chthoniobacterales bacterium]
MSPADLSRCRLYAILDLGYVELEQAASVTEKLLTGGADVVQLRAKDRAGSEISQLARGLTQITRPRNVPLIINDHAEVARDVGADGVHVGQDDMSVEEARAIVGSNRVVGKSTHSLDQAVRAFHEGADYIGFGPIFATPTKPEYQPVGLDEIERVHEAVQIPIFCIGGIKLDNLPKVIEAGARRVVIVSGLLQASDIVGYGRAVQDLLQRNSKIENQQ